MEQRETVKYLSPNQKALKRLLKNKSAVAGLVVIAFAIFLAIFGNVVSPDHSPNADDQVLEIATSELGFKVKMLLKEKNRGESKQGFFNKIFTGTDNPYEMIPIVDYQINDNKINYNRYTGERTPGEAESLMLSEVTNKNLSGAELRKYIEDERITNRTYWLGTDKYGRDNLSRLILGVRISLSVGLLAVTISLFIGILLGALAGYYQKTPPQINILSLLFFFLVMSAFTYLLVQNFSSIESGIIKLILTLGGFGSVIALSYLFDTEMADKLISTRVSLPVDDIIMYIINTFWPIPVLLLIFALILALGREFWQIYLAVGLVMWVEVARVVRGQFLGVREKEYIEAAESLGFGDMRTIFKHVLPNTIAPIIVITAANFASAIIIEAGLSFLGIGVKPPMPSWGTMLNEYYGYVGTDKAFLAFLPGLAIMTLVLAFNLVGNGLRDALDVKTRL